MDIRYKMYPYPVLAYFLDDYKDKHAFDVKITQVKDGFDTKLVFEATLTNKELLGLVRSGKASFVYHLECSQTGFRKVIRTDKFSLPYVLSNHEVKNIVQICPFIVATKDITSYSSTDFDDDYKGMTFDIEEGCVLAVGQQVDADVSDSIDDLANTPSIFSIVQNTDEAIKEMKVDGNGDKIVIQLPFNDYYSYKSLSQNPKFEPVLNALTIVPALVFAIEEMKRWDSEEMNRREIDCGWFRSIKHVLSKEFNCDVESGLSGMDSMELAQKLIGSPLPSAFAELSDGEGTEGGSVV